MKQHSRSETGAFAIDAVFGITIFLMVVLSLIFMSLIIKVQSNIQYALNQTAKEISGYYYLLDKAGIAAITSGSSSNGVKDIDQTVGYVLDFADSADTMADKYSDEITHLSEGELSIEDLKNINLDDVKQLHEQAGKIGSQIETLAGDPKSQIKGILSVFAKTMVNKGLSYYVTPLLCRAIMPRYLGGDKASTDKMLDTSGIGSIDKIDFSQSQLLTDKRSIKLVAAYKLNASSFTFGLVDEEMIFRQVASTAAWIAPDEKNTYKLNQLTIPDR